MINLIQQDKADRSTYQHLQQLIYSDSHKEAWSVHLNDQSTLCQQLINVLIESLEKDGQRPDFLQAETIAIIRSLLTHMPQNMSVDKPLASSMIRALVNSQTDNNSNVSYFLPMYMQFEDLFFFLILFLTIGLCHSRRSH